MSYDSGFYPTPPDIAHLMLSGLDMKGNKTFLDPSAGEGHLLDMLVAIKSLWPGIPESAANERGFTSANR